MRYEHLANLDLPWLQSIFPLELLDLGGAAWWLVRVTFKIQHNEGVLAYLGCSKKDN